MTDSPGQSFAGVIAREGAAVGRPVDRIEGPLKVSGVAAYAYEYRGSGETAYGFIVGSTIAKGTIVAIDIEAAKRAPGVLAVLTHHDASPPAPPHERPAGAPPPTPPVPFLNSGSIRYRGEAVALVVAESFEAARSAAALVHVSYEAARGSFELEPDLGKARKPDIIFGTIPTDSVIGDLDAAMASAAFTIDATYTTPHQHHHAMEPHASLAVWEGDKLTLYTSHQMPIRTQTAVAATLGVSNENVRVIAKYVGGGFGGKIRVEADAVLAAEAARKLGRPVKIAMTRPQTFVNVGHRPASVQRIRLAANSDGHLTGVGLESFTQTSTYDTFVEPNALFLRSLYAAPNRLTTHRVIELDLPYGVSMRAPGEATGMLTFEAAMDELAHELQIDPVEFRILNEPSVDPESGKPFSTRRLVDCLREGARLFGWEHRPKIPATRREGHLLIGYGMSAAIRSNFSVPNRARIRFAADGSARVQTAATDIGTGTYTILAQIAADELGLPVDKVIVEIGDSALPFSVGSGGSFGAAAAGSSVLDGCRALVRKLAELAVGDPASPLRGSNASEALLKGGSIVMGGRSEPLVELIARNAPDGVEADGGVQPGADAQNYSQHAYGAHFAEVSVDADTGEVRMRRMFGVYEAGRILNPKTARSQIIGGMIWGIGSALTEETIVDSRLGLFANHDLASYHVAAHADVPDIDAVFLDGYDDKANPLGIKGIGELGICGAGAAIANAVFNATGVRVREFPITLDKLLPYLP